MQKAAITIARQVNITAIVVTQFQHLQGRLSVLLVMVMSIIQLVHRLGQRVLRLFGEVIRVIVLG